MSVVRLFTEVEYDEKQTDPETLAADLNSLLRLALTADGILTNHGDVSVGDLEIEEDLEAEEVGEELELETVDSISVEDMDVDLLSLEDAEDLD